MITIFQKFACVIVFTDDDIQKVEIDLIKSEMALMLIIKFYLWITDKIITSPFWILSGIHEKVPLINFFLTSNKYSLRLMLFYVIILYMLNSNNFEK